MGSNKGNLQQCPNYGTCQTYVEASKRGLPHKYGVLDPDTQEIVYKDCSGG